MTATAAAAAAALGSGTGQPDPVSKTSSLANGMELCSPPAPQVQDCIWSAVAENTVSSSRRRRRLSHIQMSHADFAGVGKGQFSTKENGHFESKDKPDWMRAKKASPKSLSPLSVPESTMRYTLPLVWRFCCSLSQPANRMLQPEARGRGGGVAAEVYTKSKTVRGANTAYSRRVSSSSGASTCFS